MMERISFHHVLPTHKYESAIGGFSNEQTRITNGRF